jgi:hypothetical protein
MPRVQRKEEKLEIYRGYLRDFTTEARKVGLLPLHPPSGKVEYSPDAVLQAVHVNELRIAVDQLADQLARADRKQMKLLDGILDAVSYPPAAPPSLGLRLWSYAQHYARKVRSAPRRIGRWLVRVTGAQPLLCRFGRHDFRGNMMPPVGMSRPDWIDAMERSRGKVDGTRRECRCGYFEKYDAELGWHTYSDNG